MKTQEEYEKMSFWELMEEYQTAPKGKECRKIHKAMKKYGDGILFIDRYPDLPYQLSLGTMIFFLLVISLKILSSFI